MCPCLGVLKGPRVTDPGEGVGPQRLQSFGQIIWGHRASKGPGRRRWRWGSASDKSTSGPATPGPRARAQAVSTAFQLRARRLLDLKSTGGGGGRGHGERKKGLHSGDPPTRLPSPTSLPTPGESWRGPPRTGRAPGPRGLRRLARSPPPRPATIWSGFASAAPGTLAGLGPRPPPPPPRAGARLPAAPAPHARFPAGGPRSSRSLSPGWTPMERPRCSPPGSWTSRRPSTRGELGAGRAATALPLPSPPGAFRSVKGPRPAARDQKPDTVLFVRVSAPSSAPWTQRARVPGAPLLAGRPEASHLGALNLNF